MQVSNQQFAIQYGTGAVAGYDARDTFSVATPPIPLSQQTFGAAVQLTTDFLSASCDGLFVCPCLSQPCVQYVHVERTAGLHCSTLIYHNSVVSSSAPKLHRCSG